VYKYDCTFTVEVGKDKVQEPRTQNRGKTTAVNSAVEKEIRKNSQGKVTGFTLKGFDTETADGEAPVEGGSCEGGPLKDGVISNVDLVSSTGGLTATFNGTTVALPNTPTL
jgi:hypothetical protein